MTETIKIEHLTVNLKKEQILKDLSLQLDSGTITCLVAPNGTGKTTFFRSLVNGVARQTGTIQIDSIDSADRKNYNQKLFFLENVDQLFGELTVYENLQVIAKLWKNNSDFTRIMAFVGIKKYRSRKVKYLSLGMKQKVLVAVSIASGADFLLFDEPLNGLDIENIQRLSQIFMALKEEGKIVLMSSHNVFESSKVCDAIYFLINGKLQKAPLDYERLKGQYHQLFSEIGDNKC